MSPATYNATEPFNQTASVTVTVTRTSGSDGAVSVSYQTSDGTATAGTDYVATSGSLNWANGDSAAKTFQVTILDDSTIEEPNQTANLALSAPVGGATLGTSSGMITIVDSDVGVPGTPMNLDDSDPGTGPIYTGNYSMHWDDSSGAVHHYDLDEDMDADGSWNQTYTVIAPINHQGFSVGPVYFEAYYRVRACTATNQCSTYSPSKHVTVCGSGICP